MTIDKIIITLEKLHQKECKKTNQKIPQTIRGKKIRHVMKIIEDIK